MSRSHDVTVGIVGTGKMGSRMARRLLDAGFPVVVSNRSLDSVKALVDAGAVDAGSCRHVARQADIVITSLTNQQSVHDVYLGDEGLVTKSSRTQPGRSGFHCRQATKRQGSSIGRPWQGMVMMI